MPDRADVDRATTDLGTYRDLGELQRNAKLTYSYFCTISAEVARTVPCGHQFFADHHITGSLST
jgi:hypothetical protein